jgi:ribosomal protein S18 acetylase RimI-like enzyme
MTDLAWRVEAACREAWPCPDETILDGWLIRASGGPTRRTNSVNPLPGSRADIGAVLDHARGIYTAIGQRLIVRVPEIAAGLDKALDVHGFGPPDAETITLHAALAHAPEGAAKQASVGALSPEWIAARARLSGWDEASMAVYRRMLGLITGPAAFASIEADGRIAAVAYAAIAQGLIVIESVVTDEAYRGRGLARQVVAASLDWARSHGTSEACLQVQAGNAPAVALYRGLGFASELYRYHYRCAP